MWMQCDKGDIFKAKGFGKRETPTKRDEYLFMIIVTWDNKIESDVTYNHLFSLPGAYPIHRQFARTDEVKELIISQTRIRTNNKQVIITIQSGKDEKNPLVKPKDVSTSVRLRSKNI